MSIQIRVSPAAAFSLESVSGALATGFGPTASGSGPVDRALRGSIVMQKPVWQSSGFTVGRSFPSLHLESVGQGGISMRSAELLNVAVVAVKPQVTAAHGQVTEVERVELTFQKIEWSPEN